MNTTIDTTNKVGRPTFFKERMSRVTITLTDSQIELLRLIGKGNLSKGVRIMIDERIKFAITRGRNALRAFGL